MVTVGLPVVGSGVTGDSDGSSVTGDNVGLSEGVGVTGDSEGLPVVGLGVILESVSVKTPVLVVYEDRCVIS